MASPNEALKVNLQIAFGAFGIVGVVIAIASLSCRDSLACLVLRWRRSARANGPGTLPFPANAQASAQARKHHANPPVLRLTTVYELAADAPLLAPCLPRAAPDPERGPAQRGAEMQQQRQPAFWRAQLRPFNRPPELGS